MASSFLHFLLIFVSFSSLLIISQSKSHSQIPSRPRNFILSVQKDAATNLYVTNIQKRTPQLQVPFVLFLNGQFMWVTCDKSYLSSTYNAPACHSAQCTHANSHFCFQCSSAQTQPGCHRNSCGLTAVNPVTHRTAMGELAQDVLMIPSVSRSKGGSRVAGPSARLNQFLFVCAPQSLIQQGGLPRNAQGVVGLGLAPISLPNQLFANFGLARKFSICLPSSPSHGVVKTDGFVYFGEGPSKAQLTYTPLITSRQGEYFVHVSAIQIDNKNIANFDQSLLSLNINNNRGGVMISTTTPYTILQHSIFQALTQQFISQLRNSGVQQIQAVAPFGVCFDSNKLGKTRIPEIELVFQNQNGKWRISSANSMVEARQGVRCLALVDGGAMNNQAAIVIGGKQLEDNLVQFDLASSRVGFSNLQQQSGHNNCANFNFAQGESESEVTP
ncbi:hypothetical protein ACFE04_026881 [Oxalis oulophora]